MAPSVRTTINKVLTVVPATEVATERAMSEENSTTMVNSVPFPPPTVQNVTLDNGSGSETARINRRLWWAMPILTVAWIGLIAIIAASLTPLKLWELAPGSAEQVSNRLSFDKAALSKVMRYPAKTPVLFVTAFGSKLTALDAFAGALDKDVDVQSYKERYGTSTPTEQQRLGYQSMTTAKQIAEYVAYTRLGLEASFVYGDIIVEELVCLDNPGPLSGCKQLQLGDTITELDGEPTPTLLDLGPLMANHKPGDIVTLTIKPADIPGGASSTDKYVKRIQLIADPDTPTRPIIGFIPADTRTVQLPFEVGIDTDRIGGPSAGLAFTLALLDELTPGDLMGGVRVAATGTIEEDESVGAIGALAQKAVAVKAAGAKVFLVPKGQSEEELADARRAAGPSVRIEPVANLTEALAILESLGGSGISNATIEL
ncbi:MAG: PDZ domain-containing protein [Actinobacteria bacterium]|nr:PDZ domain-containing protein [Actinomycetota bacterium]